MTFGICIAIFLMKSKANRIFFLEICEIRFVFSQNYIENVHDIFSTSLVVDKFYKL